MNPSGRAFWVSVPLETECSRRAPVICVDLAVRQQAEIALEPSGSGVKMVPSAAYIGKVPPVVMVWHGWISCDHDIGDPCPRHEQTGQAIIGITVPIAVAQGTERLAFPARTAIVVNIVHMAVYIYFLYAFFLSAYKTI